ncbi:MAG: hypothetical protein ACRCW4_14115 [Candidatus Neomicrothrix subdominans]
MLDHRLYELADTTLAGVLECIDPAGTACTFERVFVWPGRPPAWGCDQLTAWWGPIRAEAEACHLSAFPELNFTVATACVPAAKSDGQTVTPPSVDDLDRAARRHLARVSTVVDCLTKNRGCLGDGARVDVDSAQTEGSMLVSVITLTDWFEWTPQDCWPDGAPEPPGC